MKFGLFELVDPAGEELLDLVVVPRFRLGGLGGARGLDQRHADHVEKLASIFMVDPINETGFKGLNHLVNI